MSIEITRTSGRFLVFADTVEDAEEKAVAELSKLIGSRRAEIELVDHPYQLASGDVVTHEWRVSWESKQEWHTRDAG